MSNQIILKTEASTVFHFPKVDKVLCILNAENIAKLLDHVSLAANPRESKKNKVTAAIIETLETAPEEMVNRTKGLLIATHSCEILERGRFRLSFNEEKTDGVLDGGHNLLAIGTYLLETFFRESEEGQAFNEVKRIRCWEDFAKMWQKYGHLLDLFVTKQRFSVPVEIIFPNYKEGYYDFAELVFEISDARNNNSPLTAGTKADHRGHYNLLKSKIDPSIANDIAWKDNESGKRISREDIVALSLIPMIALQRKGLLDESIPSINPITIYNSKTKCVELFSQIVEAEAYKAGPPTVIQNALALMQDIPRLYDEIYKFFPEAYNASSPGFGRITAVKKVKESQPVKTKFYNAPCLYKYPDGYIIPFVCALHELIVIEKDSVRWGIDSIDNVIKNSTLYSLLVGTIKDNHFDPVKVGKSSAAYSGCEMAMKMVMMNQ